MLRLKIDGVYHWIETAALHNAIKQLQAQLATANEEAKSGRSLWKEAQAGRKELRLKLDKANEENHWIPVGERLPKLVDDACQSEWVDVSDGKKKVEGYYYDYTGRKPMSGAATGKGWYCHGMGEITYWREINLP